MSRHYLVVSDLHLCDIEDHPDGWKAYKSSRFVFDDEFAKLVDDFTARCAAGGHLVLLLNGDIVDFDLVTAIPPAGELPVSPAERWHGLNPTAEKSAWKLRYVLAQHPSFVAALARFLVAGHRVVYLLGNHDRELHFPAVQQVLRAAVEEAAARAGASFAPDLLCFEPWCYCVPGEIYAEHGHQFDYYSAFKNQLEPTIASHEGPAIAVPMGNLSNRYLMTRMGFFNPHATDYILNFLRYVAHWAKHYLFSRRSLAFTWLWGSLLVIAKLTRVRQKLLTVRGPHGAQLEAVSGRTGLAVPTLKQINRLHRQPITNRFYRIVREFWLDRVLLAIVMTGGTITLALVPIPLWIKLMVPLSSFPLLYFIYEWFAEGENLFGLDARLPGWARTIAALVDARVVTFGHTHRPRLVPLAPGATFVDTGAWAPITESTDMRRLAPGTRNYLIASFVEGRTERLELGAWG